jgi:hypothetical protein
MYPVHQSLGQSKSSQSSLVVACQRIYNSLTVTTAHIKSSFRRLTPMYSVVSLQLPFSFFHNCQLRNSTLLYPLRTDLTENAACIIDKACLTRRCLAIYLLLFRTFAFEGMCFATRCLALRRPHRKQFLQYLFCC